MSEIFREMDESVAKAKKTYLGYALGTFIPISLLFYRKKYSKIKIAMFSSILTLPISSAAFAIHIAKNYDENEVSFLMAGVVSRQIFSDIEKSRKEKNES